MNETKYTKEDLKTMQAWDLERKIRVTQTRIIEWYKHWNGKVSVSFSGGKDSTVLLDLARRIYPDIEAVFVDTGLEYPEIREFVKSKDNVTWLKPEMSFRKVIETYGYPVGGKDTAQSIELGRKALAIIMQSKWTMVTEHIWNTVGKKDDALENDYDKPLEVRWLCFKCHREWHKIHDNPELLGGNEK